MSLPKNFKQFQLKNYPEGIPNDETWKIATIPTPELKEGEVLLKLTHLSVDPYMRSRMRKESSFGSFSLNSSIATFAVGTVVSSKNEKIKLGETYSGIFSLSEYHLVLAEQTKKLLKTNKKVKQSYYLSAVGMPGGTAWWGVEGVLEVKKGHSYFVNAALGAVGAVSGQIAKLKGAYVVGSAGGPEKCKELIEKYGFDAAIDYRKYPDAKSFSGALKEKFPKGIDRYFDNVGGYQTDAVVPLLNKFGRIAVCGQISQYNKKKLDAHGFYLGQLIYKSIRIEGFTWYDLVASGRIGEFGKKMGGWLVDGKVKVSETIFDGFEAVPNAFLSLFTGKKKGKVVVKSK